MDRVGVGESQTHVTLWWDARARAVLKKVRDNGGKLSKTEVDATMVSRIIQGKVNGLAYDAHTGQVYTAGNAHLHMSQRPNPAPPPPFAGVKNMQHRRHSNMPQPVHDAQASLGGAGRVDPRGYPHHVGNPPMAGDVGGILPRGFYGGVGGGGGGGGGCAGRGGGGGGGGDVGGGAHNEPGWTTTEEVYTVPESCPPSGVVDNVGMMHTGAGMLPQPVPPSRRSNNYVHPHEGGVQRGVPQGIPQGASHSVRHNAPRGVPQPYVVPESGSQTVPQAERDSATQAVPHSFSQAVPCNVHQAEPHGMSHGLPPRASAILPGLGRGEEGGGHVGRERPSLPPPAPTTIHRAHHQQDERSNDVAWGMPARDAAPKATEQVELNFGATEWNPSQPAPRFAGNEAIREFQELVRVPHPPPEAIKVQARFERDGNKAQYMIDIWNWFAAKHRKDSALPPPAKADAARSAAGASIRRGQTARPAEPQRAPSLQPGGASAEPSKSVALFMSEGKVGSGDAQLTPAEFARKGLADPRADQETTREFQVWAKTPGAPLEVFAGQNYYDQGRSRDQYIRQAEHLLGGRDSGDSPPMPRQGLQSDQGGGDDPVVWPGDLVQGAPGALHAQKQQQAREGETPHAANQMANKPKPPSPVVKTLEALVRTGPAMDNIRNAVLGPSEGGLLPPVTQPPSSSADILTVGAIGAAAAGGSVPSPDHKGRAEELAAAEASADPEAGKRVSSLTLESVFRKGKKARRRREESAVGEAEEGDGFSSAPDSSLGSPGEESGVVSFLVDDGDAGLADVGTDRDLATDGVVGKNGEGTTAGQAKIPQAMRAAPHTKPTAAVSAAAASASAPDPTTALAPHDAVNTTAATIPITVKSAATTAGAASASVVSSMPTWPHESNVAVRPATKPVMSSTATDGRVKPLAVVHSAVAPAAASTLSAAPAPTQATTPLRQEDSVAPGDGNADRVAPISSIADVEKITIFLVRDAPSMADAATALGAERGAKGAGLLRNALRSTGPVAVRLDGRDLGAEDGVIQTVQIAGGAKVQKVVIFDVQALMETRAGNYILSTELRSILEDVKIRKVMHDVHDHVAALAHFFPGLPFRVNTVLDLELVGEALGGDALNSFGSALWSFDVCDDPNRKFAVDEATFARRPLGADVLLPAAYGVVRLRESCKLAEEALVAAGELANVFRASQMKADYAAESKCRGWRRMTFTDDGPGIDGNPGKKLASFELQKASELRAKGISRSSTAASTPHGTPPTPETHFPIGAIKEAASGAMPKPRYIPPPSAKQNNGVKPPSRRTVTFSLPTDTEAAAPAAPAAPAWSRGCKGAEKMEAEITFGSLGSSPPVSSNADSGSFATLAFGGGSEGGGGKVGGSSRDSRGGGDAGGGGDVRGGATRGDDARIAGSQDARMVESPSQQAPPGTRDGLGGDDESESGASSCFDQDDEDADVLEILKHLPNIFVLDALSEREMISGLEEVVLDLGTRPRALVRGIGKVYLCDDEEVLVTRYHISCVVGKFEHGGVLGTDDRTGFDGLLHSVGVMRDKNGTIYGVTIRVRGFVNGVSDAIDDLLFNPKQDVRTPSAPSILVLGGRSAGKTTLMRDVCRKLSFYENVLVVDTRNDIGGDAVVPHRRAIGESRRIMVPPNTSQHSIMRQGFRNHNPQTLVIDEISSQEDIKACHEMKTRGVRVIAGAVGTIPSVLDSPLLGRSLGGLDAGDASDSEEEDGATKKEKRAGVPVFDVVIEVEGGRQPTWTVVTAVAKVVDELLANGSVAKPDRRTPLPPDAILQEAETEDCVRAVGFTGFMLNVSPGKESKWLW